MARKLLIIFFFVTAFAKSQCPQVFDYLGNLSSKPYWISCTGGAYNMNFQSNSSWGTYTISWGDGSADNTGASYTANTLIPHTYTATIDTFVVKLMIPSLSCTLIGVVVMEKAVNASIQIPFGGITTACAPATLQFINSSTDVSKTTKFNWNFGDGSPLAYYTYTNSGQTINHTYSVGTACQTQVTLKAQNYCSFGNPTIANFNPIQIYDKDVANITPSALIQCWPNATFTFSNTTTRNCLAQGNNFQRQEYWNFGKYWGNSNDSIYNWKPWPPTTPITITYTSVGTYTVMLKDSSMCGVVSSVISVNVVNPPIAGVIAPAGPLCQNAPITFTNSSGTGYFYKWNFGDGGGFVSKPFGPQAYTYTSSGTYTVKVVAFIPGGGNTCSDTAKVVVNILPAPASNFTFAPTFGCNTLSGVTFTDISTGAIGWNWTFGNGNTSNVQVPPAQNYTTTGTFTVSLAVTSANTCVNTKTATITVYQKPVAAFSPTVTCVGAAINYTDQSTFSGSNPITNWTWNFGDGSATSAIQNPAHTYTAQNTYTVKLVVKTAFCSDSITKNVLVNIKPTASFIFAPPSGCPVLPVTFTNTSANGTNYFWNFGASPTSTSNAVNPSFSYSNSTAASIIYTVTLIAGTGAGCSDTIKQSITVFPKPVASYTSNAIAACTPLSVTFTNTSTGATGYTWIFGDGSANSTQTNTAHQYINTTLFLKTFTCQLVATNSFGCSDTVSQVITAYPKPLFSFTMVPASGCAPLSVNFPPVLGAVSYSWNFGDGNTSTLPNPTHTFTNTTSSSVTYTVTLIATNAFGCMDTAYGMPVVFPLPTSGFTLSPNIGCSPVVVNFTNTSIASVGQNWNFGDGYGSVVLNPSHTFTSSNSSSNTTYSVKLVVTSVDGCKDSIIHNMTLFPKPDANFTVDTPACSPKILNFTNLSTGATTHSWNFGNGNFSTSLHPTQQYINNSGGNQGYIVTLISSNSNNCSDTIKVPIVIHPHPNFNIALSPDSGCAPLKVNFPSIAGAVNYNWNFGDGSSATTSTVSHTFNNSGNTDLTYNVQLIATNSFGCADTTTRPVKVFALPNALFQVNPTTIMIPAPINCVNLSVGNKSNYWTFGDGGSSTAVNPSYNYTVGGEYVITLIVTNAKGCKDTFSLPDKIIVDQEYTFQVPNAFTPSLLGPHDGPFDPKDLSNDVFHPVITGRIDKYEFSVFSRWGELLFDTKDVNMGWDGYYKGKLCTQDVYIWKLKGITYDGQVINKTGDVTLLK